ncbi:MAG: phage tail length tape measure family protein, partial [Candidatus Paceibacterota bacterium]
MPIQGGNVEYVMSLRDLLTGAVNKAKSATHGLDSQIKQTQNSLGGLQRQIATFVSVYAVFDFAKDSVKAFNDEAQQIAGIQQILKNTGGAAGVTSEQLLKMAAAGQATTTFADEQILASEKLLLSFTKIKGSIYTQAVPAIQDMAAFLNIDLTSATETVGKALNNPIRGMMLLGRQGFYFTDQQKSVVEEMTKTGRVAEAQGFILAELEKRYKG